MPWGSKSRSLTPWALRTAARDGFGVDADDLAELADDHDLAGLIDEVDAGDLADLGDGLHIDDTFAAAGLGSTSVRLP